MKTELTIHVFVKWEVIPESIGGSDDRGNQESIPESINITGVFIQQNGANIEITEALTDGDIEILTDEIINQ